MNEPRSIVAALAGAVKRYGAVTALAGVDLLIRTGEAPAEQLAEALRTVRNSLSEAIGKLDVDNRIEAYRLARQKAWL